MELQIRLLFLFVLLSAILTGCEPPDGDQTCHVRSNSYVLEYIEYRHISLSVDCNEKISIGARGYRSYGIFSTDEYDIKRFEEKSRKNRDFSYSIHYWTLLVPEYIHCVPERDIVSIDVYSDAPFDSSHPAGTSLADCFYFVSVSPYRYIQNGYTVDEGMLDSEPPYYYDWNWEYLDMSLDKYDQYDYLDPDPKIYLPVYGLLSDLDEYDFRMIGICDGWQHWGHESPVPLADLVPAKMPEGRMVHTLTVRIEDTEGFIFKKQIRVDFSE